MTAAWANLVLALLLGLKAVRVHVAMCEGGERVQAGRCTLPGGETVTFQVNDEQGVSATGVRVFAGLCADPFFLDVEAGQEMIRTMRLAFKEVGTNFCDGWNVLSVVVEVECASLLAAGAGPLFAVVAETVVAGKLPIRLEHVGRPEVKNVILGQKVFDLVNRDLEIRESTTWKMPSTSGIEGRLLREPEPFPACSVSRSARLRRQAGAGRRT